MLVESLWGEGLTEGVDCGGQMTDKFAKFLQFTGMGWVLWCRSGNDGREINWASMCGSHLKDLVGQLRQVFCVEVVLGGCQNQLGVGRESLKK